MTRKNAAAVELGRKGGKATARNLTLEERKESARRAAKARWARTKELVHEISEGAKKLEQKALRSAARGK